MIVKQPALAMANTKEIDSERFMQAARNFAFPLSLDKCMHAHTIERLPIAGTAIYYQLSIPHGNASRSVIVIRCWRLVSVNLEWPLIIACVNIEREINSTITESQ